MNARYTLSIHVELGAVRAALLEDDKKIKEAVRTVRVREHLVKDFFKTVEKLLQEVVENVVHKNPIAKTSVFVASPLAHVVTDKASFEFKKSIPHIQHIVHEIEQDVPVYVGTMLGEYARDGVYVQHIPHSIHVRGYEVPLTTQVVGPYEGAFYMQWVTRSVYEAIRATLLPYNVTPLFMVEEEKEHALVHIGAYVSQFFIPRSVSAFPLAFGTYSLRHELADMYDVPLTHVDAVLHGAHNLHVHEHPYNSFVYNKIHSAIKGLSSVLPTQVTHQVFQVEEGPVLRRFVERAFKDVCGYVPYDEMKTNKK